MATNLTLEDNLLITCARIDRDDKTRCQLESILASQLDWDYILEKATLHRVAPLLFRSLKETGKNETIPQSVMEKLRGAYYADAFRNMSFYGELSKVLKCLKSAAIEVIVLKGTMLAEKVYQNIALRPFNDIDLLVKKASLFIVENELSRLGYCNQKLYASVWHAQRYIEHIEDEESHYINSNNNVLIDLHWGIQPLTSPFQIDVNEFWKNAQPDKIAGVETLVLAPEDLIEHLCIHLNKEIGNASPALLWCCDIAEVVSKYEKGINWGRIVGSSKQHNIEIPIFQALHFAHNLLGAPVPTNVLSQLESGSRIEILSLEQILRPVPRTRKRNDVIYFRSVLRRVSAIKGNRNKWRYMLGYVFPSQEYLFYRYSLRKPYLLHFWRFMHPGLIIFRLVKALVLFTLFRRP